jgi:hypothetical protein
MLVSGISPDKWFYPHVDKLWIKLGVCRIIIHTPVNKKVHSILISYSISGRINKGSSTNGAHIL